jgi:hypothetical protein
MRRMLLALTLAACSGAPSDARLTARWRAHRDELERLAAAFAGPLGAPAENYRGLLYHIDADVRRMADLGVIELVEDSARCRKLLVVHRRVDESMDVYVEEKGYLYTGGAPCGEPIPEAPSLDGLDEGAIAEGHGILEGWRMRRLDDRWALYVRQTDIHFLH